MDEDRFRWDPEKAANLWKHGVAFEKAAKIFRDLLAIEQIDDRDGYGEERVSRIGMCDGVLLHVDLDRAEKPHSNHLGATSGTT